MVIIASVPSVLCPSPFLVYKGGCAATDVGLEPPMRRDAARASCLWRVRLMPADHEITYC